MNFDVNTLSTLMQLMSAQKPRESDDASRTNGADNVYNNRIGTQGQTQSVFAMQNGLGQHVDISSKPEKKSQPTSNPMSAIFDMMSGKGGSGNADMMSSLMPMLMNMMSKPAQVAENGNKNKSDKSNQSFEQKLKNAMDSASGNDNGSKQVNKGDNAQSVDNACNEKAQNRQSNQVKSDLPRDKYSPISFAGYALICSLNKLYMSKKYELK